jgi:hypothetical protein
MTMMSQAIVEGKAGIQEQVTTRQRYVKTAAPTGTAAPEVERGLLQALLKLGHRLGGQFFDLLGDGDQGPPPPLSAGQGVKRLDALPDRRYVSVFGEFKLKRRVYGTREGPRLACVPWDNRWQLPAHDCSYLLQDWTQGLAVEMTYQRVSPLWEKMLGLKGPVSALERMNGALAMSVQGYWETTPAVPSAAAGLPRRERRRQRGGDP